MDQINTDMNTMPIKELIKQVRKKIPEMEMIRALVMSVFCNRMEQLNQINEDLKIEILFLKRQLKRK